MKQTNPIAPTEEKSQNVRCANKFCDHYEDEHTDGFGGCNVVFDDPDPAPHHCVCSAFVDPRSVPAPIPVQPDQRSWSRVTIEGRPDIIGARKLEDGRREFLMHNEVMCNPYWVAIEGLPTPISEVVHRAEENVQAQPDVPRPEDVPVGSEAIRGLVVAANPSETSSTERPLNGESVAYAGKRSEKMPTPVQPAECACEGTMRGDDVLHSSEGCSRGNPSPRPKEGPASSEAKTVP